MDVTSARFWTGVAEPETDVARTPATAAMAAVFMVIVVVCESDGIDLLTQVVAREELVED
jgi:hypothetical protein